MPKPLSGAISPANFAAAFNEYLTQAQIDAYRSEDPNAIAAADEQTLQQAIAASTFPAQPCATPLKEALERANLRAETALEQRGFRLVRNVGNAPNCLLASLLQHAQGNYRERLDPELGKQVAHWRAELVRHSRGTIASGDSLYANDPHLPWLAERILGKDVRVDFWCADADGKPQNFHSIGNGRKAVMIFDRGGHFEAIVAAPGARLENGTAGGA